MSLAMFFSQKCLKKMEANVTYISQKLAHPETIINFNASEGLKKAVAGGMSGLYSLGESYVKQNADALILSSAVYITKQAGAGKAMTEALQRFQDYLAAAYMAQNDLIYKMTQEVAVTIMEELSKKDQKLVALADRVRELYAALSSLVGAPDYWTDYYSTLRQALALVASTRTDLNLVYSTLKKNDYWLQKKFDGTVTKLEKARDLITPKNNNPAVQKISEGSYNINRTYTTPWPDKANPAKSKQESATRWKQVEQGFKTMGKGLAIFGDGLTDTFPFPTKEQTWQATLAVGRLSNFVLIEMEGYFKLANKVNAQITGFKESIALLRSGMPSFIKEYVLKRLEPTNKRVNTLVTSMSLTLNGEEGRLSGPKPGYKPNSLAVTVSGFKWVADINLILQGYKTIPKSFLDQLSVSQDAANKYKSIVARINNMYPGGSIRTVAGRLAMTGGIEELGDLEIQLIAFLLEANNSVISGTVRKSILPLGRAILGRLELGLKADHELYALMEEWANYELPENELLNDSYSGLLGMLVSAGLDRVYDCLKNGDFSNFFKTKGITGTYTGAALDAVAKLLGCKLSTNEYNNLKKAQSELNSDMDLFNFSFSIDFDLAIFANILECLRLRSLADIFTAKEVLCAIVQDIANGNLSNLRNISKKMKDAFTNPDEISS
jgi:hypothetical protein